MGVEEKQLCALKPGILRTKTQAVHNKNNKPAEFLIKGPRWDNTVKWGALHVSQVALVTTRDQSYHHRRRKKGSGSDNGMLLASSFGSIHQLCHREIGRTIQSCSMVPHVAMDSTMLMLDQSHWLGSESGVNTPVFMCGYTVFVLACVVWVQSLMWNARESPNHPVFHLVLLLPHSFLSSVSFSSFALSAIWPRWTDLWQKCSDSSVIMVWVALMGLILFHQILLQKLHRQLRQ